MFWIPEGLSSSKDHWPRGFDHKATYFFGNLILRLPISHTVWGVWILIYNCIYQEWRCVNILDLKSQNYFRAFNSAFWTNGIFLISSAFVPSCRTFPSSQAVRRGGSSGYSGRTRGRASERRLAPTARASAGSACDALLCAFTAPREPRGCPRSNTTSEFCSLPRCLNSCLNWVRFW